MEALRWYASSRLQGANKVKWGTSSLSSRPAPIPSRPSTSLPQRLVERYKSSSKSWIAPATSAMPSFKASLSTLHSTQSSSISHPPKPYYMNKSSKKPLQLTQDTLSPSQIGRKASPARSLASTKLSTAAARMSARHGTSIRLYSSIPEGTKVPIEPVLDTEPVKTRTEPPPPPPLWMLYLQLSKARLGAMVVLSTIFGYLLAPGAFDPAIFTSTVLGTAFTVASANTINQYLEVEYDSMMKRTKNRPLPAGHMTPNHALGFGVATGAIGTVILGTLVSPISATLAFSNIILYTMVYTPLKRVHPLNTAVGALVGAIPPLIGWAAQTGGLEAGAWVAFLVMSLWQMPHFHALSWPLRHDYANAGYRMLVSVKPDRAASHTLAYTIASLALAPFAVYTGLATPHFALLGALPSLPWIYYAYKFYTQRSNLTARQTFKWSLYWLPLFFALLALSLAPDQDRDTIEEDVIAIHQQSSAKDSN